MYNPNLHFHFTGIGGSGMSGIAEVLLDLGFQVSGSDLHVSEVCKRLIRHGAVIEEGHAPHFVPCDASLLVYSSAVNLDNPEVQEAIRRNIPVVPRAEVLAELVRLKFSVAVAGTHGKTTTTSMIAAVMECGELDPTVIIGGQVKAIGSGAKLGKGAYLVAETDESDRSFLLLKPTIAVVTNIEAEHMESYSSFGDLRTSFKRFIDAVPFYGVTIMCADDPTLTEISNGYRGRRIGYGLSAGAHVRAENIVQQGGVSSYDLSYEGKQLCRIELPMPGEHMVLNSLAAVAVGLEFGISLEGICKALANFTGVKRRIELLLESGGVTFMSDFAHHPTEILATLRALREAWGEDLKKIHVVFQPHRYSRTRDCFDRFMSCFAECDHLYIADIYPGGEKPLPGISSEKLVGAIQHPAVKYVADPEKAARLAFASSEAGDMLLFMGAGSIGAVAEDFVQELRYRRCAAGEK